MQIKREIGIGILGIFLIATFFSCGCIDVDNTTSDVVVDTIPDVVEVIPIPDDYYLQGNQIPSDISLIDYLTKYEWTDEYEAGKWDCSQMSAAMECMLENSGYDVVIQVSNNHAWILIYLPEGIVIKEDSLYTYTTPEEGWYAYECTGRYFIVGEEHNNESYNVEYQCDSIFEVWEVYSEYGEDIFLQEWGWWKTQ